MSEQEQDIREAAAAGAAAAVDAIVEEQHEDARADAVATAAAIAEQEAAEAAQHTEEAAEAATVASTVAVEAHAEATEASVTAQQAAEQATEAQSELAQLREHIAAGFHELRGFITESLAPKEPDSEPTEVVVSDASTHRPDTEQARSDAGSGAGASGDERPYRHRFGRSRG